MRKVRASCGAIGVTMLAVTALWLAPFATMSSLPTESPAKVHAVAVTVDRVEQVLAASGRVRFASEYAAISPVSGIVAQVYVRPGDHVTAGQALFRLDGRAEEAALAEVFAAEDSDRSVQVATTSGTVQVSGLSDVGGDQAAEAAAETSLRLASMTVRAAADGRVQQVKVAPYDGIMAGTAAVALSGDEQRIRCSVVARDAQKLRQGLSARILSEGVIACEARVAEIGTPMTDASTGQTVSEVTLIPAHALDLPLGASVDVEIVLAGEDRVTTLPLTALTAQDTVWWLSEGRCWEMPVSVLLADEVRCWVALPEGIRVVDRPSGLIEGQRIKEMKP